MSLFDSETVDQPRAYQQGEQSDSQGLFSKSQTFISHQFPDQQRQARRDGQCAPGQASDGDWHYVEVEDIPDKVKSQHPGCQPHDDKPPTCQAQRDRGTDTVKLIEKAEASNDYDWQQNQRVSYRGVIQRHQGKEIDDRPANRQQNHGGEITQLSAGRQEKEQHGRSGQKEKENVRVEIEQAVAKAVRHQVLDKTPRRTQPGRESPEAV